MIGESKLPPLIREQQESIHSLLNLLVADRLLPSVIQFGGGFIGSSGNALDHLQLSGAFEIGP